MHDFQEQCENCVPCKGVFVIIFFETMYVKKKFRLFFCDIWSNQGHSDGVCDGKCISSLRTAILCRVVQRIYRVFRISHCIYMYTCRVCFHGSVRKVEYDMKTLLWSDVERLMRLFFVTEGLCFEIILLYTGS